MIVLTPGRLDKELQNPGFKAIVSGLGLADVIERKQVKPSKKRCCGGMRANAEQRSSHRAFCQAIASADQHLCSALVAYFGDTVYLGYTDSNNRTVTKVLT
jgi:hypothetical protein